MPYRTVPPLTRRELIGLLGLRTALPTVCATQPLRTLRDWLQASEKARRDAVQVCLQRIAEIDPSIHAWVEVAPQKPTGQGPLSGIPFGAKDVFETAGLATEFGSPIYKGRRGATDAAVVSNLRRRGAILLGKTHTAAFAYRMPPPTRNPRNRNHTPGGSSSGSAAAVAAGMAPFTIGTQTRGSVLRPASFCGVTGFKPTYGRLPTEGLLPLAKSLDTVGFFTHRAADMAALWESLGNSPGRQEDLVLGVPDPMPEVAPEMNSAFQHAVSVLRAARFNIHPIQISGLLSELDEAARVVMMFEGARAHQQRYEEYGSRLDAIADLVRDGRLIPDNQYEKSKLLIHSGKSRMSELFQRTPVILTPAATGPAPLGLASTGDPRMNSPWTALGTPAISIPMRVGEVLPLGLQITADYKQDSRVLQAAVRIEETLNKST